MSEFERVHSALNAPVLWTLIRLTLSYDNYDGKFPNTRHARRPPRVFVCVWALGIHDSADDKNNSFVSVYFGSAKIPPSGISGTAFNRKRKKYFGKKHFFRFEISSTLTRQTAETFLEKELSKI